MDVERPVEVETALEVAGAFERVAFGVRRRKLAARVARAGYHPAAEGACHPVQAQGFDLCLHGEDLLLGNIRDQQILPDGQADGTAAVTFGDAGEALELVDTQAPDGQHDAHVEEPLLALAVEADVAMLAHGRARLALFERQAQRLKREELARIFPILPE